MKKSLLRSTFFIMIATIIVSIIVTFISNIFLHDGRTFFHDYINFIYFVNLPVFIIGAVMFITESGLFNVFVYSTNKVRSVVSAKYRFTLHESEHVEGPQVDEFLKNKYLYADHHFEWTLPLFLSSSMIYGVVLAVVVFYYGI